MTLASRAGLFVLAAIFKADELRLTGIERRYFLVRARELSAHWSPA